MTKDDAVARASQTLEAAVVLERGLLTDEALDTLYDAASAVVELLLPYVVRIDILDDIDDNVGSFPA